MKQVYNGDDIVVSVNDHLNAVSRTPRVIVTFSPRAPTGLSPIFGGGYLNRAGIAAVHVQSRSNHWWHTPEIDALADLLRREGVEDFYLYGASMGGYGGLMLPHRLGARGSISLSPQAAVLPEASAFDNRWMEDRSRIKPQFDESTALAQQADKDLWVFLDRNHYLDTLHFDLLSQVRSQVEATAWNLIEVPYGDHAVGRPLQRSSVLSELLQKLAHGHPPDNNLVRRRAATAYRQDPKTLLNFLRQTDDLAEVLNHASRGRKIYAEADQSDPEVHFMAAEFFLRVDQTDRALQASERSVVGRLPAPHLVLKHARVLRNVSGEAAALDYLWRDLAERLDSGIATQALTLMRRQKLDVMMEELAARLKSAGLWNGKMEAVMSTVSV
jgi:pimeloyl-ACP methyl ester carboxylesterase